MGDLPSGIDIPQNVQMSGKAETLGVFKMLETGDFLLLFNRSLHGIFYIDEYNIYQQLCQVFIRKMERTRTKDFSRSFSLPLMA